MNLLVEEYALSPQANHRKARRFTTPPPGVSAPPARGWSATPVRPARRAKPAAVGPALHVASRLAQGGLIGLAAATVGLAAHHEAFLGAILPPVLRSFSDQDSRVRYYACEALYNIAKVSRGSIIPHFNEIFDALCQLSADADPSVQARRARRAASGRTPSNAALKIALAATRACAECGAPAGPAGEGHCDGEQHIQVRAAARRFLCGRRALTHPARSAHAASVRSSRCCANA